MNYKHLTILSTTLLAFSSCVNFNDATSAVSVSVQIIQPADYVKHSDIKGKTVTMLIDGQGISATTDENGLATFRNIVPDIYSISTSWAVSAQEYADMTGSKEVVSGATVSGTLNSQLILKEETIPLPTNLSIDRDIVIGKVFYAASKDNNNRNYIAGKYIELYNQSNNAIDVSGLYLGVTESESTPAFTHARLHEVHNDTAMLLKQVYRIPTDKPHMVEPGGTVIICNSAIDHTTNNSNDHDLSNADFEIKDAKGTYQNNPLVPAMEHTFHSSASVAIMNILQSGPVGVVIFRTDEDIDTWKKTYADGKTTGTQWLLCPVRVVLDAVEALKLTASGTDIKTKRIPAPLDAGYTNINAISGWNGETIYRKTLKTAPDGHRILVDTNNSSNDFQVSKTIQPREYDE